MVAELVTGCCAQGVLPARQALHSHHPSPSSRPARGAGAVSVEGGLIICLSPWLAAASPRPLSQRSHPGPPHSAVRGSCWQALLDQRGSNCMLEWGIGCHKHPVYQCPESSAFHVPHNFATKAHPSDSMCLPSLSLVNSSLVFTAPVGPGEQGS